MIGWYVHHQGQGHLNRARALVGEVGRLLGARVAGLSSLPEPLGWPGPWITLPDDEVEAPVDPTAGGRLHYVPVGGSGLLRRTAAISRWLEQERPVAVVVDVSVEVTMLVRLHGVPVVSFVLPGRRTDPAHLLGLRSASALVAAWPPPATRPDPSLPGLPEELTRTVTCLGGVSRLRDASRPAPLLRPGERPRAVVLQGRGGGAVTDLPATRLDDLHPQWRWAVRGGRGEWVDDPTMLAAVLERASLVVTQAGQGSIADVAAARVPAVVVASPRPFGEQETTVEVLAKGPWPVVATGAEHALDGEVLRRAAALDGGAWSGWVGADAAHRLAGVVEDVAICRARCTEAPPGPLRAAAACGDRA